MSSPIDNAITRAQFQLRGGWRSALIFGGLAVAAIAALALITLGTQGGAAAGARVLGGWVTGLLIAQAMLCVLVGASVVGTAIKKDVLSGLIESHRLMPVRPVHAAIGYVAGAVAVPAAVGTALFACGLVATSLAGVPISYWLAANLILLLFSAFWWTVVAFVTFATKGTGFLIGVVIAGVWVSGGQLLNVLPPMAVLVSPLIGPSIFDARLGEQVTWAYGASAVAQMVFAGIFLVGAGRRYRSDLQPALGVAWALALLAAWTAVTLVGLQWWDVFRPTWMRLPFGDYDGLGKTAAFVTLSVMLLAMAVPIAAAARARRDARVAEALGETNPARTRVRFPAGAVMLLSAALALAPLLLPAVQQLAIHRDALIATVAIVLAVAVLVHGLSRLGLALAGAAGGFVVVGLLLFGVLPVIADVLLAASSPQRRDGLTMISDFSPFAALVRQWSVNDPGRLTFPMGVIAWTIVGLLLALVAGRFERTQQRELRSLASGFAAPATSR
jgi:hypothetical protein